MIASRALVFWFLLLLGAAPAPDKEQCATAYEDAQRDRKNGRLLAARSRLEVCTHDACPAIARKDCVTWLAEVDRAIPTVRVEARDAAGRPLEARVFVDGALLKDDARVDPGPHTFRVEIEGGKRALEERVTVLEGDKDRRLAFTFSDPAPAPPPVTTEPPPAPLVPVARAEPSRGTSPLVFLFGAIGAAGVGSFAYFGLSASADRSDLQESCAPFCAESDVDRVFKKQVVADVSLATGLIALGVGAWLLFGAPEATPVAASDPGSASTLLWLSPDGR